MPIYEFECKVCRKTFEVIQKDSKPIPDCPKCGNDKKPK